MVRKLDERTIGWIELFTEKYEARNLTEEDIPYLMKDFMVFFCSMMERVAMSLDHVSETLPNIEIQLENIRDMLDEEYGEN